MHILLETERMVFRRFTTDDEDNLFELDADPEVLRFINGGQPTPRHVVRESILPRFSSYDERSPEFGFWAAIDKETASFMGWFSFRRAEDEPGTVRLGYRLRREFWGMGLATEGSLALLSRGFEEWGVQRVTATTYQENVGSRRVLEKVGMSIARRYRTTPEEILNTDTYHVESVDVEVWDGDDLEYAIVRAEWDRLKQEP